MTIITLQYWIQCVIEANITHIVRDHARLIWKKTLVASSRVNIPFSRTTHL